MHVDWNEQQANAPSKTLRSLRVHKSQNHIAKLSHYDTITSEARSSTNAWRHMQRVHVAFVCAQECVASVICVVHDSRWKSIASVCSMCGARLLFIIAILPTAI